MRGTLEAAERSDKICIISTDPGDDRLMFFLALCFMYAVLSLPRPCCFARNPPFRVAVSWLHGFICLRPILHQADSCFRLKFPAGKNAVWSLGAALFLMDHAYGFAQWFSMICDAHRCGICLSCQIEAPYGTSATNAHDQAAAGRHLRKLERHYASTKCKDA